MKRGKSLRFILCALTVLSIFAMSCSSNEEEEIDPTIPVVTTDELSNTTYTTQEIWGTVVSNGGADITSYGFCWIEEGTPTINDHVKQYSGNVIGQFHENIEELEEGTNYSIRAFAKNSVGVSYGEVKTFTTELSCQTMVQRHPGYQVWAGNESFYSLEDHYDYFYNIDKHGYVLIGESTETQTFSTGNYNYYVIVANYWSCIDAIQFADGSYYDHGQGYTLYSGLSEETRMMGAPDEQYGKLGGIGSCPPNNSTFNGFVTDDKTILSRGGGLTVIVGEGCQ